VDADLYWFVRKELLGEPGAEPTGLTFGSLEDDWSEVASIGTARRVVRLRTRVGFVKHSRRRRPNTVTSPPRPARSPRARRGGGRT
jgi:hypothetical protein